MSPKSRGRKPKKPAAGSGRASGGATGKSATPGKADDSLVDEVVAQILASSDPRAALHEILGGLGGSGGSGGLAGSEGLGGFAGLGGVPGGGSAYGPRENPEIELPDPPLHPALLTVRVDITGAKPPIWRRLALRGDLTLDLVHEYLQAAMGWADCHLHRFGGPNVAAWEMPYFVTEMDVAEEGETGTLESTARLDQVLRDSGDTLTYIYDFGDDWIHRIKLESTRPATEDDPPAVCLTGRGACPPEDVGGIWTWNELAAALRANPDPRALSGDLEMYAEWLPPSIDPGAFDAAETTLMLSLVGADPDTLLAALNEQRAADGLPPVPRQHPALDDLVGKSTTDVVLSLGMWSAQAIDPDLAPPTSQELADALQPWRAVLDAAGSDGIPLTQAGWMAPAVCERIWHESGLSWDYGKGNREQHTPELQLLRAECLRAGLLRKYKGRLVKTPVGRRAADDVEALAQAVAASLVEDDDPFGRDTRVLTLLLVAAGWEADPEALPSAEDGPAARWFTEQDALRDEVARTLTEIGWRENGGPIARYGLRAAHDLLELLTAGLPSGSRHRSVPRSPGARHLARLALFPDIGAAPPPTAPQPTAP